MSGSLGEAVLDLRAPIGPLQRDLGQARNVTQSVLGGIAGSVRRIFEFTVGNLLANAFQTISAQIRRVGQEAMQAVGRAQMFEKSLGALVTEQLMYARNADGVYQQVRSFGEASEIAAGQTQDLIKFVERLALVSPFETKQVEEVIRLGLAADMSADKVKGFTAAFLDYAAAHGITSTNLAFAADQFLQLRKSGTLTAIDLRQLRRLGIDVSKILGVKLGMSVEQFNDAVKQTPELMDLLFDAFTELASGSVAGAAADMAQTVDGMMATMGDIVELGSRNLFRPIVEAISPVSLQLMGKLSNFVTSDAFKEFGKKIGDTLALGISGVTNLVKGDDVLAVSNFASAVERLLGPEALPKFFELVEAIRAVSDGARELGQGDVLGGIDNFGYAIGILFGGDASDAFVNNATLLAGALTIIKDAVGAFASGAPGDYPWEDIFPEGLADTMYRISEAFEMIRDMASEGAGPLEIIRNLLLEFGGDTGLKIVDFFEGLSTKLQEFGVKAAPYVLTFIQVMIAGFIAFATTLAPIFSEIGTALGNLAYEIGLHLERMGLDWGDVGAVVTGVVVVLGAAFLGFLAMVSGSFGALAGFLTGLAEWFQVMALHVRTVFEMIGEWLEAAGLVFERIFAGDMVGAIEAFRDAWDKWWKLVGEILESFADLIAGALLTATGTIEGFVKGFSGYLVNLHDTVASFDLRSAAVSMMDGFLGGVRAKIDEILGTVRQFGLDVAGTMRNALNSHSPSKVTWDIGWDTGEGYELGLVKRMRAMMSQTSELRRILGEVPGAFALDLQGGNALANTLAAAPVNVTIHANVANDVDVGILARRVADEIKRRQR